MEDATRRNQRASADDLSQETVRRPAMQDTVRRPATHLQAQPPAEPTRESQRIRSPHVERVPRRQKRHLPFRLPRTRSLVLGGVIGVGGLVAIVLVSFLTFYFYYQTSNLILPGVHVGDIDLSGMSHAEATAILHQTWNEDRGLIVTDGDRSWYAPPSDFGLALDPSATAQRALNIGHGGPLFAEMATLVDASMNGQAVAPVVTVNSDEARAGLTTWSDTINIPAQNATIVIDQAGQVSAVPGKPGYALNVDQTLAVLVADPGAALFDGYLPLVLEPVQPEIADVSAVIADAERMLTSDLIVQAYDPITDEHVQWTASRQEIAGWLTVEDTEAGPELAISISALESYLKGLSGQLGEVRYLDAETSAPAIQTALENGTGAASVQVMHESTTYVVQGSDTLIRISWKVGIPYWRILEANPGLDADTLSVGQEITIPSVDDLLPLPVVVGKRIVVDIGKQRLYAYENGQLKWEWVISTGIDRSPTQPGIFQVQTHEELAYASVWDLHMPHFIGIYESWPGFMNGFHGLPSRNGGQLLWADSLGRKTSFGCIILDLGNAEKLYAWAEAGVVVEIIE